MPEYQICNIKICKDGWKIGNYEFVRAPNYENRLNECYRPEKETSSTHIEAEWESAKNARILRLKEISKTVTPAYYGSHQITAIAKPVAQETNSVFQTGKTKIFDILLIYNFLTGLNTCLAEDMVKFTHKNKVGFSLEKQLIQGLLNDALDEISKPEWQTDAKDKEILAFLFYLNAKDSNQQQIRFLQFFTCLDMYDGRNFTGAIFRLCGLLPEIQLSKMDDFVETLRIIRNKYVHEGSCSLATFKSGLVAKKQISPAFKNDIDVLDEQKFFDLKFGCSQVLDFYLFWFFCQIFTIANKVDKKAADFEYEIDKVSRALKLFK